MLNKYSASPKASPKLSDVDEIQQQQALFQANLPMLIDRYPNRYVLFDRGEVIDADRDPDLLLDRIFATDLVKQKIQKNGGGIYCYFIPESLTDIDTKMSIALQDKLSMKTWIKEMENTNISEYTQDELDACQEFEDRLMAGE